MQLTLGLLVVILAGTGGEIAVARAMRQAGMDTDFSAGSVVSALIRALGHGWLWTGVGLHSLAFAWLLALLSWAPVTVVVPLSALSYVAGALGAMLFLGESISPLRWAGIIVVSLGVLCVAIG